MNPHSRRGALGHRVTRTCVTDITSFLKKVESKEGVTNVVSQCKCSMNKVSLLQGSVYKGSLLRQCRTLIIFSYGMLRLKCVSKGLPQRGVTQESRASQVLTYIL